MKKYKNCTRNIGRIVHTCPIHKTPLKQFQLDYMFTNSKAHVHAGYCSYCQCFYINAPECKESKFYINQGQGHTKIKQIQKSNYKQQQIMNILNKGTRIKNKKCEIGTIIAKNKNEITVTYPNSNEVNTYLIPDAFKSGSISLLRRTDNKRLMAFIKGPKPVKKEINKKEAGKKKETKKIYILRKKDTDEIYYNGNNNDNKVQQGEFLRVRKTSRKDIRSFDNIVYKFQLVDSIHNHYSVNHNVINKTISLAYADNDGTISIVEFAAHYCSHCKKYFDFEESFLLQLQEHDLNIERFLTRFENQFSYKIQFENNKLNEYSKLRLFGYHVGGNGLPDKARHELLNFLLETGLMTAPEIKNMLQFYIRFNGKKKINMSESICDWKSDIKYINDWILEKGH